MDEYEVKLSQAEARLFGGASVLTFKETFVPVSISTVVPLCGYNVHRHALFLHNPFAITCWFYPTTSVGNNHGFFAGQGGLYSWVFNLYGIMPMLPWYCFTATAGLSIVVVEGLVK